MKGVFNLLFRKHLYLLIPENEPVSRQRFALFRIFSILGACICAGVATKMVLTIYNAGPLPLFIYALGVIMLLNYFLVKTVESLKRSYLIMLTAAVMLLHIVSYSCGGIRTAGTMYFGVIILYAYMLLGRNAGKWFTIFVMAHVVYLFVISSFTDWTSFSLFKDDILLINEDFLVNALLSFILIAVQGNYLQSNKNEVIQELEKQKKQLQEKNEDLENKNNLLNSYATDLEKTNSELRKFASVASHDLKAPLRAIGSLAGFIEDEEEGRLKPKSVEFFDLLKGRVSRMDRLLNALLEYSAVIESSKPEENVDVEKVINNVAEKFAVHESVQIGISGKFPVLTISESLVEKVFINLMDNAIRFNPKANKEVSISGVKEGNHFWFTVKDNGPGIDPVFHEKIFVIFQTLNPRDEFETMGIGLPVVKKIVEHWNGKIEICSDVNHGSVFKFCIPDVFDKSDHFSGTRLKQYAVVI